MTYWNGVSVCETPAEVLESLPYSVPIAYKRRTHTGYLDITATLDIETTNTREDGFAYTFQGCILGAVFLVRYIEDFCEIVDSVIARYHCSGRRKLVIYVHNLGYEYMYMGQYLEREYGQTSALYTKSRKPLYVRYDNGLELRDSFKLFQKSLARATKGCPHAKKAGDLDYTVYRTPETPLTYEELGYCVCDVLGLYEAIERLKRERGYNQASLPLSNTGIVIDTMNTAIRDDKRCRAAMSPLKLDRDCMRIAYNCMAGGDTHGARWYAGRTLADCNSYDFKSAHPSQQLLWKFPAGAPVKLPAKLKQADLDDFIKAGQGWCARLMIADLQVRPECPDPTISVSKCEYIAGKRGTDNGRLLGADGIMVWMDSNDWQRFRDAYEFKDVELMEGFCFKLAYLPEKFRRVIVEFFKAKESLPKDDPDYMFSKVCINTIFGACAQKTIRDEYTVAIGDIMEWDKAKWQDVLTEKTDEAIAKSQDMKFPFLWGLWTSSLSRLKLWEMLKIVGWERVIYWDTDSCKYIGPKCAAIEPYNARIRVQCAAQDCIIKGKKGPVYIGVAEDEHPGDEFGYRKFRFLHAKCYAVECSDGHIEATIAGVGKAEGVKALAGDVDNLANGLVIKPAGGQALTYHDRPLMARQFGRQTEVGSFIYMEPRRYEVAADFWGGVLECEIEA